LKKKVKWGYAEVYLYPLFNTFRKLAFFAVFIPFCTPTKTIVPFAFFRRFAFVLVFAFIFNLFFDFSQKI